METSTTAFEKKDSITLKRNAKGEYAWDIKTYYDPAEEEISDIIDHISYLRDR